MPPVPPGLGLGLGFWVRLGIRVRTDVSSGGVGWAIGTPPDSTASHWWRPANGVQWGGGASGIFSRTYRPHIVLLIDIPAE